MINFPSSNYDYISKYFGTSSSRADIEKLYSQIEGSSKLTYRKLDASYISDTYDLNKIMKNASGANNDTLLKETSAVMSKYYDGEMSADGLKSAIQDYVKKTVGSVNGLNSQKNMVSSTIATAYEYFSRANARCAVDKNSEEGIRYFTENGVKNDDMDYYSKLKGTVYYSGEYYHLWEDTRQVITEALDGLAGEYGVEKADYESIEKNTMFGLDGGLTFNGVWNYHQYQTNHHWMDVDNKTSIINEDFVPPEDFVYAFTNSLSDEVVEKLKEYDKMKENASSEEEKKGGTDLKQYAKLMLVEMKYGGFKLFGQNNLFSNTMSSNNWNFLMPSSKNNFSDYYRALYYKE